MKAIICTRYGPPDVLQLKDVAKPAPKDDEVLIRVNASSINSRDWRLMRANPFFILLMAGGLLKPKTPILGADVARLYLACLDQQRSDMVDRIFPGQGHDLGSYSSLTNHTRKRD